MKILFELSVDDVLTIFEDQQIVGFKGVRSQDALESAVAAPFATFDGEYLHQDLFAMGSGAFAFIVAESTVR